MGNSGCCQAGNSDSSDDHRVISGREEERKLRLISRRSRWESQRAELRKEIQTLEAKMRDEKGLRKLTYAIFHDFDSMHNGQIVLEEFVSLSEDLFADLHLSNTAQLAPSEVYRAFRLYDTNGDGRLDYSEFQDFGKKVILLSMQQLEEKVRVIETKIVLSDRDEIKRLVYRICRRNGVTEVNPTNLETIVAEFCHDAQVATPGSEIVWYAFQDHFQQEKSSDDDSDVTIGNLHVDVEDFSPIVRRMLRISLNPQLESPEPLHHHASVVVKHARYMPSSSVHTSSSSSSIANQHGSAIPRTSSWQRNPRDRSASLQRRVEFEENEMRMKKKLQKQRSISLMRQDLVNKQKKEYDDKKDKGKHADGYDDSSEYDDSDPITPTTAARTADNTRKNSKSGLFTRSRSGTPTLFGRALSKSAIAKNGSKDSALGVTFEDQQPAKSDDVSPSPGHQPPPLKRRSSSKSVLKKTSSKGKIKKRTESDTETSEFSDSEMATAVKHPAPRANGLKQVTIVPAVTSSEISLAGAELETEESSSESLSTSS